MSAHTPGPWHAAYNDVFWEIRSEDEQIGDVCASKFIGSHEDNPVAEHNARLMAAAPYMFAALDEIGGLSRALRQGGPDPMDLEGLSDALELAISLASAAIAKAKGETA